MRGNPLFRLLGIAAIFALAGLPVRWVTRGTASASADLALSAGSQALPAPKDVTAPATFRFTFTCVPAPEFLRLEYLGKDVFGAPASASAQDGPSTPQMKPQQYTGEFSIPALPAEGADFVVRAQWPKASSASLEQQAALRLVLESGGVKREATFWSQGGAVTDVMTFLPARRRAQD
ncbi:MAG: hypothetical protein ACAI35_04665 [Candidatus Methylacidiphilales bacterium]|nr:hypothetical protein [Candidatus Methylacidiphilales bacterium]